MKTIKTRLIAIGMALAMVFSMIPAVALSAVTYAAEATIKVYLTVSNKGELAKANDGSVMAQKPVDVSDLDGDGNYSFDEALIAAHKAYNSEDGYAAPSGYVSKLWGVETYNSLYFINDKGLSSGVAGDFVKAGDFLTASVNSDDVYYSDFYSFFDKKMVKAEAGKASSLSLSGFSGMAGGEAAPVANAAIRILNSDGSPVPTELTTDANGAVSLTFDTAGIYYVSAAGTVPSIEVTNWNLINLGGDPPVYGTMDWTTYDSYVAYTDADYGNGPYPASEIKYIDFFEWKDLDDEGEADDIHVLHSAQVLTDAPLIAPASIVVVTTDAGFEASAGGKQLSDMTQTAGGYSYYDWNTYETKSMDLYTINLPQGTETVDLSFTSNVLAYNYDASGNYLDGYYEDYHTGAATASVKVDANADSVPDFIQIQTPYYPDPYAAYGESSDMLYAITFRYDAEPVAPDDVSKDLLSVYKEAQAKADSILNTKEGAVYGNEWLALDMKRDAQKVSGYYVESLVNKIIDSNGILHTGKGDYTNYAKAILTLTAFGIDASDINGINLIEKLADFSSVSAQGVNGVMYALLALDSATYELPEGSEVSRDTFVNTILGAQLSDGGWDWANKAADPDMTAIAIQALAPYYSTDNVVQAAVNRALDTLSKLQQKDGGFQTEDAAYAESSESSAMVILALCALGIDPSKDTRFIKEGKSALDNLCTFAVEGGGFAHTKGGGYNALATDQGYRALAGYMRLVRGVSSFYDMNEMYGILVPVSGRLTEQIFTLPLDPSLCKDEQEIILNEDMVKAMNGTIESFYDISCIVTDNADHVFALIDETDTKKDVEVTIPADKLPNLGEKVMVAGIHEDTLILIDDVQVDRTSGKVKFKTDKFSTYAVVSGKTAGDNSGNGGNAKTGDHSNSGLWIFLASLAVLVGIGSGVALRKRTGNR